MKRYILLSLLLIVVSIIMFNSFTYRDQNLAELLKIEQIEKMYLLAEDKDIKEFEFTSVDEETINKLANYFNQYSVKLTTKDGWISKHEQERFELYLQYRNGELGRFTLERDVVVSDRVYEVVDGGFDYTWIKELERDIHPK